jgi:hypothetical protein
MALGPRFPLQNDGTKFPPGRQHLKTMAVGRLFLCVKIFEDFGGVFRWQSLQKFMGFHGDRRLPGIRMRKAAVSQAPREFDTQRQSRLYPAQ